VRGSNRKPLAEPVIVLGPMVPKKMETASQQFPINWKHLATAIGSFQKLLAQSAVLIGNGWFHQLSPNYFLLHDC